ncbi:pentatricopeptide repeat-containing protein At5g66520-like [Macadamia integrifolia]|uniref:pentatricopeptide repeat-containing protein At5g66520-like n=1 Tax=Macadamia integrifolia TaxID=60698 RepID=UPI001C4EE39E|nr:pentatricopeptide repeat-containing protein At5g66520-like [Macadamia integrifolia]
MIAGYLARKLALLHHPSLSLSLSAFTNMSELKRVHAHIIISGLANDDLTTIRLLAFAAISGDFSYAQTLFNQVEHPTLFMYNSMIRGFSQSFDALESIHLYIRMLRDRISPDNYTFPFLFQSCSNKAFFFEGQQLHDHALKFGIDYDVFVLNNLIRMYSNCRELDYARRLFEERNSVANVVSWTTMVTAYSNSGDIDVARQFFDRMPCRNTISWTAMIVGYAQMGKCDEARQLFDEMPERDVDSWSAMISGYAKCGMWNEAFELFTEMVGLGIRPNESALVSSVSACVQLRALEQGVWLHSYIEDQGFELSVTLGTSLVDMYCKCGSVEKALKVFNEMPVKNVLSWNSMIGGLAMNGCGKQALSLFWRMQMVGLAPNGVTFLNVLHGCSHSGLVDEGRRIFDLMTEDYEIEPQLEHYGCMVDLLGRAGLIKEALNFVDSMPVKPHAALWGALFSACRIHGHEGLGEELGKHLIELEPDHSGRYTLLSNMYAAARRWDDVETVRKLFKERGVSKNPGNSIVEAT